MGHRLAEKGPAGAKDGSARERMSPCGKNRQVCGRMAGFSHPKVVASLQPPEGQPLPEPAVCLSLSPVPPGFTDCPLHAMDRRCGAGPTPSHGLAWPSRRLGNSGYISLGIHLFPRGKLLCDTCAGTLGEGEEEASCDTEGLRMTRRMTSEPPPLSQPGDAGG